MPDICGERGETGSCGCIWITEMSQTRSGPNMLCRPENKVMEDPESCYRAAC